MYCESCGSFIPDGQAYCSNCGAQAPVPKAVPAPQPVAVPVQPIAAPVQPVAVPITPQQYSDPNRAVILETPIEYRVNHQARNGLIAGIISIQTGFIPVAGLAPGVIGLVLSIQGLKRSDELGGRGRAIGGIITSAVGLTIGSFVLLSLISNLGN